MVGKPHAVLTGAYAGAVLWLHERSTFLVTTFGRFSDWTDYQEVARASVGSGGFWAGTKPMGYALLAKVLGEGSALHWGAVVVSIGAWVALALAVAALLRARWQSVLGCAVVLGFSLSERIQVWNDLAGSEALSVSLFVLALAAGLVLVDARRDASRWLSVTAWAVLAVVAIWWCFTRDSNALVLLLASVVGAVFAAWKRSGAVAVVCAAAFVVSVGAVVASSAGDRWVVPYYNVVFNRVLTDEDLTAAWREAGMPVSREVRGHVGEIAYAGDARLFEDRRLVEFRDWVRREGRRTYVENLLTRPGFSIGGPVSDLRELLASRIEVWGRIGGTSYAGSPVDPVVNSLFVPDFPSLLVWLAIVAAAAGWLLRRGRLIANRGPVILGVVVLLLGIPHLWLVWIGDAHNIARHAVTASVQIRLTGWIVLLLAFDEWLAQRRASRGEASASSPAAASTNSDTSAGTR